MKSISALVMTFALVLSVHASDVTVKISKVHLCCDGCVNGVQKAIGAVPGVTASTDKNAGTVDLTGPDNLTVQKAADGLVAAGYFGKSSSPSVKINNTTGAKGQKVQLLGVKGVHLCCGKCVKAVDEALKSVSGVEKHTAARGVKSFEITGDFSDVEVFAALQKAGMTGKAVR
jgi:copper chaperone CopZ